MIFGIRGARPGVTRVPGAGNLSSDAPDRTTIHAVPTLFGRLKFPWKVAPKPKGQPAGGQPPAVMELVPILGRGVGLGKVSAGSRALCPLKPRLGVETPDSPFHSRALRGGEVGPGSELLHHQQSLFAVSEGVGR